MRWPLLLILVMMTAPRTPIFAQMPTYNFGRVPSDQEIRVLDTYTGPMGKELPPGKGTAREGEPLFAKKCIACHGKDGEGNKTAPRIIGGKSTYPFATTIWSFINSAMPRNMAVMGLREGTLSSDEVYALTAYILFKDGVIQQDEVMDAKSLPRVHMPRRDRRLDGQAPPADESKH
jgi:cytochrome c